MLRFITNNNEIKIIKNKKIDNLIKFVRKFPGGSLTSAVFSSSGREFPRGEDLGRVKICKQDF